MNKVEGVCVLEEEDLDDDLDKVLDADRCRRLLELGDCRSTESGVVQVWLLDDGETVRWRCCRTDSRWDRMEEIRLSI